MPIFDYSDLSTRERLDLISELWDSIDPEALQLTDAQAAELDRRYATSDEDIKQGKDAFAVLAELRARHQ